MPDGLAIGRVVVDPDREGSGFAVSTRHVVTAFHCVAGADGSPAEEPISFRLGRCEPVPATVEAWDADADVAALKLEGQLPSGWTPLVPATPAEPLRDVSFQTEGFPTDRHDNRARVAAHGRVLSLGSVDGGAPALMLFVEEVAAGRDPHGFSGAPVLVDLKWQGSSGGERGWAAVAVIRWAPPVPGQSRVGYGGSVYACPLEAIAAKCPAIAELVVQARRPDAEGPAKRSRRGYRIDFDEELRAAHGFVGRETPIERIRSFARQHDRGYVHLEASAGLGKTALAARFALLEQAPAFFADAGRGTVRAEQCLQHLSAELVDRHGLPGDLLGEDTGSDSTTLTAILGEAAEHGPDPLWLVVDGLDEAEEAPPGANPLLLPRRLPAGAFMLVTSREPASEMDIDPATPLLELRLAAEGEEERQDLERYVTHRLETDPRLETALAGSPTPPAELARRLADAAEGNFMYITYVLADLAEGKLDLETPPRRLTGYYERRFWAEMEAVRSKSRHDWERLFRPVLDRLAVAAEPVDLAWLAHQVGQPAEDVDQIVLRPWRRFLRIAPAESGPGWRIVHRSFADFLASKLDLPAAHREVAAALQADLDAYGHRHLTEHLRAGGEVEKLIALVKDPVWERLQLHADPSAALFIHDVEQARLAAEAAGRAGEPRLDVEVWCALAVASARSTMQLIPPALLKALVEEGDWSFERARDSVLQIPDPAPRARGLLALSAWEHSLVEDALAASAEVASISRRAEILAEIAGILPEDRRTQLLADFLDQPEASETTNGPHAVARLVPLLSEDLLPRVFEIAEGATYAIERAVLFLALTQRVGQMAAGHPTAVEAFEREGLPARLVNALEVEPGSAEATEEAKAVIAEMAAYGGLFWAGSQRNDAWALKALAPRLDRQGLKRALLVSEASGAGSFGATDAIALALLERGDPQAAWDALAGEERVNSDHFPVVAQQLRPDFAHSALERADEIKPPYARAEAIGSLARLLPQEQRRLAVTLALPRPVLGDAAAFAGPLRSVSPHLTPMQASRAMRLLGSYRSSSDIAYGLAALAPALDAGDLPRALNQALLVSYKADDIARAAVLRRLSPEAVRAAAGFAVTDRELGIPTAIAMADGLDPLDREELLESLAARTMGRAGMVLLAMSPYLSEEQVAWAAALLDPSAADQLEALRAICPGESHEEPAVIAERLAPLQVADELVAHSVVALAESGRGEEALQLAKALDSGAVTSGLAMHHQALPRERLSELAELALRIHSWDARLRALAAMAGDLDDGTLRRLCATLEEMAVLLSGQLWEADRHLALLQRRASLLPLYGKLPAADRQPLARDIQAWLATCDWPSALELLRVIDPLNDGLPTELIASLHTALSAVLRQLGLQPRDTALVRLGWVMPVIIGIGGTSAAVAVGEALLEASERWA